MLVIVDSIDWISSLCAFFLSLLTGEASRDFELSLDLVLTITYICNCISFSLKMS